MIVGTAGHIDHGKTTLVRALTGVDTDRLKEEKARGISIELGYAYKPLPNGDVLGFVDVPGHERLVHTMVAGACGIDVALLVIAADDGVMPQTREHLAIMGLLGITRGVVALTKCDRVDAMRLQEVQMQVRALLADTPLHDCEMFAVNAVMPDDAGVQALRTYIENAAIDWRRSGEHKLFRLAIDRVFSLPGQGLIAAGSIFTGQVAVGEHITVMPSGVQARVRSLHAQNRPAEHASAGHRCAVNLSGVEANAIRRGDWLVDGRSCALTQRIDTDLTLLQDARSVAAWTPLHVHIGSGHFVANAVPLSVECIHAGAQARVQLVFDEPICVAPGDRFIVRDAQALRTVGGGRVLDPYAPTRRRRAPHRMRYLDALERLCDEGDLRPLLEQAPHGVRMSELMRLSGRAAEHLTLPPDARRIDVGEGWVILEDHWRALGEAAVQRLAEFHERAPDEPGADIGRLRRMCAPTLDAALWRRLVDEWVQAAHLQRSGPWLHLPAHRARLSNEDAQLFAQMQPMIAAGRFDPPWVRTLAQKLATPEERVRAVLRKQARAGAVCEVVPDLFYDRGHIESLADLAAELAQSEGSLNASRFRDALGLGRKRTIQILEFFDRVGYMRRIRDVHVVRADSGWR